MARGRLCGGAQQVTLERDSPLYAEPRLDAAQVTQLKLGATGEVIGKQGAWLNLKTAGRQPAGCSRSTCAFRARRRTAGDSGAGSAAGRLFGPRRNVSVTSTIGIRGIEEEDLKQASFNAGQMKLLESYAATQAGGRAAARAARVLRR